MRIRARINSGRGSRLLANQNMARIISLAALLLGCLYLNPAYALLGAMMVRLFSSGNPFPVFSKYGKKSLQAAIIILGFTIGFQTLLSSANQYALATIIYICFLLSVGSLMWWIFRLDKKEATLITGGTAICGGTAIATLSPIIDARPRQIGAAMALVFVLNAVALIFFPYIGGFLNLSQEEFGAWVALAIHDTSSVVATAAIYGEESAAVATTVKLGRTLFLVPLAFVVALIFRSKKAKFETPWFVLGFILAALAGTLVSMPVDLQAALVLISKLLLVFALWVIGCEIDRDTLRSTSPSVFYFGLGLWAVAASSALFLIRLF